MLISGDFYSSFAGENRPDFTSAFPPCFLGEISAPVRFLSVGKGIGEPIRVCRFNAKIYPHKRGHNPLTQKRGKEFYTFPFQHFFRTFRKSTLFRCRKQCRNFDYMFKTPPLYVKIAELYRNCRRTYQHRFLTNPGFQHLSTLIFWFCGKVFFCIFRIFISVVI